MDKPKFVYVTYIATTPEKLWTALTGGEFTRQYWGGRRIESDWKPGSPVKLPREDGTNDWRGEVLQADPPKLLSYTFEPLPNKNRRNLEGRHVDVPPERPSRVTFEIVPIMGQVKLTLIHDDFEPDSKILPEISQGWPAILSSLKSLLEGDKALFPDWR